MRDKLEDILAAYTYHNPDLVIYSPKRRPNTSTFDNWWLADQMSPRSFLVGIYRVYSGTVSCLPLLVPLGLDKTYNGGTSDQQRKYKWEPIQEGMGTAESVGKLP